MTVTSGPESSEPFAFYDPDSSCWRTSQGTFPWDSGEFSATWPKQGTTRGGRAYEAPTLAPPTAANASSLLPTPAAQEPGGTLDQYHERLRQADGREPTFAPLGMLVQLLPTTTAEATALLPTPQAADGERTTTWIGRRGGANPTLRGALTSLPFGAGRPSVDVPLPDPSTIADD